MDSLVFIIALYFALVGIAYGVGAKTVKSDKDVMSLMSKTMETMGSFFGLFPEIVPFPGKITCQKRMSTV